jgi:hypothetical protein
MGMIRVEGFDAFWDHDPLKGKLAESSDQRLVECDRLCTPLQAYEWSDSQLIADREVQIDRSEQGNVSLLTEVLAIAILIGAFGGVALIAVSFKLILAIGALGKTPN